MQTSDADRLRDKQDRIIAIVDKRGFDADIPVSGLQHGCPSANEMRRCIYPMFEPSFDAFLSEFEET